MTLNILHRMDRQFSAYIRAVVPQSLLVGLVAFVVMRILGVPGAMLIAGVVGLTNIVPYFGPAAGLFVGALYCVFAGEPELAYRGVLPAVVLAQLSDNLVIGPAIIGRAVNVHPLVVIVLLIVAGTQFGVLGLLVAVPLWVLIRAVVLEVARATDAYGRFLTD